MSKNDEDLTIINKLEESKEKGYDPISQFKGYIISGDLGYISNEMKQLLDIEINDIAKMIRSLKMHRTSSPIANRQLPITK